MTRFSVFRHTIVAVLIASLNACSSSDSNNSEPDENLNVNGPSSGEELVDEQPIAIDDEPLITENEVDDIEIIEEGENAGAENDNASVLIPPVVPGSDLDRVVQGLTRQAASTLLDLNQRISQGETLTAQQEQCLGAYEEGFGQPLMAVNCDQPLAIGDVELWVDEAGFYDTAACREALSSRGSEGCILERLTLTIRTYWIESDNGDGPPTPAFPGAILTYGVDEPVLTLQNADSALTGVFSCSVNLETASTTSTAGAQACNQRIEAIADEIERLQNFPVSD